jgi:hypothetical protein
MQTGPRFEGRVLSRWKVLRQCAVAALPLCVALAVGAPRVALAQQSAHHAAPAPRAAALPAGDETWDRSAEEPLADYSNSVGLADAAAGGLAVFTVVGGYVCLLGSLGAREPHSMCYVPLGTGIAAVGTYLVASPIIHAHQGRPGMGMLALGLRLGLPAVGLGLSRMRGDAGGAASDWVMSLAGALGAMLIDWTVLTRGDDDSGATAALSPYATPGSAGLLLRGRL